MIVALIANHVISIRTFFKVVASPASYEDEANPEGIATGLRNIWPLINLKSTIVDHHPKILRVSKRGDGSFGRK